MSKSKLNIELDQTKIDPNDIDGDGKPDGKPFDLNNDGVGFEREDQINIESRKEMKYKKKGMLESINLNIGDGLRLVERLFNKWLGYLVGNNENPVPSIRKFKLSWFNIIMIVVLIILLWIK